jgi:2-polyprenyl-3-methyl-5-hydroxy-6-metoxy-1,4-benzoquinol methylase
MNNKKLYRNCPLCNSLDLTLVIKATSSIPTTSKQIQITDKFFGLHGDIVKCKRCGFNFVGKDTYVKKVAKLYKFMTDKVYLQEEKERRSSFINILKNIEKLRNNRKGKILDIGCFTGGLLVEAKKRSWDAVGVDPSEWACAIAKKLHGLNVINMTIEKFNNQKKYDAITILDVLEHVENPKNMLKRVCNLLKDDGLLCIVTPDYGSFVSRILKEKWWGIRLAHLSYFSAENLDKLICDSGFQSIKRKTYVRYFSLYYIFVRLFPIIDSMKIVSGLLKKIHIPLVFFDTFEFYLTKRINSDNSCSII